MKKINSYELIKYSFIIVLYLLFILIMPSSIGNVIYPLLIISFIIGFFSLKVSTILLIIVLTNFFSTYTPEYISGFSLQDCALFIAFGALIKYLLNFKFDKYDFYIGGILLVLSLSIFVGYYYFDQSLIEGVMRFRSILILTFVIPLKTKIEDKNFVASIYKYLLILSLISMILIFIQSLNINRMFLTVTIYNRVINDVVYSRIIMHTSSSLLIMFFIINLFFIIKNKRFKTFRVIYLLLCFYNICFISQTRIYIFSLLVSSIMILFLYKPNIVKDSLKLYQITLLGFLILSLIIFSAPMLKLLKDFIFDDVLSSSDYVRIREIRYFLGAVKNKFWGGGFLNTSTEFLKTAFENNLYLSDIGIFGYYFYFGIPGILLLFTILLKITKMYINEKNKFCLFIGFFASVIVVLTCLTVCPIVNNLYLFIIILCCIYLGRKKEKICTTI